MLSGLKPVYDKIADDWAVIAKTYTVDLDYYKIGSHETSAVRKGL